MNEQQLINAALLGSDYSVFLDKQKTIGKVNDVPEFDKVSRTGGKGETKRNYVKSETISSDRQCREHILDSVEYSAELNGESDMQAIAHLASAIHGVTDKMEITDEDKVKTSPSAEGFFVDDAALFGTFKVGDYFWVTNFSRTDVDGGYRVTGLDTSNRYVLTDPKPDLGNAEPESAPAGQTMVYLSRYTVKNGKTVTPYTIQNRVTDESKSDGLSYQTWFDGVINTMSLEFPEEGMCKFSLSMLAASQREGSDALPGQTDKPAETGARLSAVRNVKDILINGVSQKIIVKSLSMEHNNNYSVDKSVGTTDSLLSYGDYDMSGSLVVRMLRDDPHAFIQHYENGTTVSLSLVLDHGNGKETILEIPKAKITECSVADGANALADVSCTFNAEYDEAAGCSFRIVSNWEIV